VTESLWGSEPAKKTRHMDNKKVPGVRWHKKLRYWFEWLGVALSARIIPLLSLALLRLLADLAGWLAFALDRKGRAVALANLQAAFREERDLADRKAIARRSLQLFGRSFLELFWSARLNANNVDRFLYFEDDSAVKERCSIKSTPAPIFLTIHFSNFEWASVFELLQLGFDTCQEFLGESGSDSAGEQKPIRTLVPTSKDPKWLRLPLGSV